MLKILYSVGNNVNSKIQLTRFLQNVPESLNIKVAAFKKSSPKINIDWTLDCLLDVFNKDKVVENDNLKIYLNQIKYFNPDLIISDMEHFTSQIALELNIPLWQCSSSLINHALSNKEKNNLGLFKKYGYLTHRVSLLPGKHANIIENSNRRFIYSHLGDLDNSPNIKDNFEWIRPYHLVGKKSILCQHNMVVGMINNNKKILSYLKNKEDIVVFSENFDEYYSNMLMKDISNQSEFSCNLKNSDLFINEGYLDLMADAFYNGKFSVIFPNLFEIECIINSLYAEKMKIGVNIYDLGIDLEQYKNLEIIPKLNKNIKFLHEKLTEL